MHLILQVISSGYLSDNGWLRPSCADTVVLPGTSARAIMDRHKCYDGIVRSFEKECQPVCSITHPPYFAPDDSQGPVHDGVMMRESLNAGARAILFKTRYFNPNVFIGTRTATNQSMTNLSQVINTIRWMKIQRSGNTFNVYTSFNGTTWTLRSVKTLPMGSVILVGIFAERGSGLGSTTVCFDHVEVVNYLKAEEDLNPIEETGQLVWNLFPNPTSSSVMVDFPLEGHFVPFSILNPEGILVRQGRLESDQSRIDLNGIRPGLYLFRIEYQGKPYLKKLAVE